MKIYEYQTKIRESLLDTYGHVNNAAYITLFEEARWEFISERGYGLKEVLESRVGPVILSLKTKFKKEVKARENVTITIEVVHFKHKVGVIKQELIKEDGTVATEAEFEFGIFDIKKKKLVEPDEKWRHALALDEI